MKYKKRKKKKSSFTLLILLLLIMSFFIINKLHNNNKNKEKSETEIKLEKLNNINEKIDFFKMENLDRYIKYKEKSKNLTDEEIVVYVNIGLDNDFYTNQKDSPNKYQNTVLANKYYYLGEDYVPKDLTLINEKYSSDKKYMTKDAANAFEKMAEEASKKGYTIRAVSTYRSYNYQTQLYNQYMKKDGKENADTYSARAGYSEHQTGLAVDVDNNKLSYTSFGKSKEFEWMQENAYKYGFILRYTKEYEPITGYINEPWHYRYVGTEIAKYIQNNPMTYEEYYVRFLDK